MCWHSLPFQLMRPEQGLALRQFLSDHPEIKTISLHLDNDEAGRKAVADMTEDLSDVYEVVDAPPRRGKDVNDLLRQRLEQAQRKEEWSR